MTTGKALRSRAPPCPVRASPRTPCCVRRPDRRTGEAPGSRSDRIPRPRRRPRFRGAGAATTSRAPESFDANAQAAARNRPPWRPVLRRMPAGPFRRCLRRWS
eukprot:TRINITY_DN19383_c0_g1_i2.p3 TRINITY_DN19383_c0_g1~~TRINITY_DN19383_c0_g1_i2.p3  ORF type:complete len:103 (-),score=17.37 TRINITY_DN19383_c0_g1_i2:144-452(-)